MDTQWIIDTMETWSPKKWAMANDNVGLQVGDRTKKVSRILTALDLTESVIEEAVQNKFDFIVTHHPLISRHVPPVNSITTDNVLGKKIITLIANGIGHFCAHTNLDVAPQGVNELLFELLQLKNQKPLLEPTDPPDGRAGPPDGRAGPPDGRAGLGYPTLGLVGDFGEGVLLPHFAKHVATVLNLPNIRYVGSEDSLVKKVAICGGSGGNSQLLQAAISQQCDTYVTGDIGHHFALEAAESGISLIDGTHYATEVQISLAIANHLTVAAQKQGLEVLVEVSRVQMPVFRSL